MKVFRDSKDREWKLELTIGSVKRVNGALNVNLLDMDTVADTDGGGAPVLQRLGLDVIFLCDVIYALVSPQADEQSVSDVEFGESLGGDVIMRAQKALYEELVLFFQGLGRSDLATAIAKQLEIIRLAVRKVDEEIQKIDLSKKVAETVGKQFTNLRESSGLTPTP